MHPPFDDMTRANAGAPAPAPERPGRGRIHPVAQVAAIAVGVAVFVGLLGGWSATSGADVTTPARSATLVTTRVIHAPIGYEASTGSGATNGPVTPTDFDSWIGAGSATAFGYVRGYDVTYDCTATNESIEVTVFSFRTHAEAGAFTDTAVTEWGASSLDPVRKSIPAIHDSIVELGTKAGQDGFYLVDAFATKGDTMMVLEYANTAKPTSVPHVLKSAAVSQYALL